MAGLSFDGGAYPNAVFKALSQQWGNSYIQADGSVDLNNAASLVALDFYKSNMDYAGGHDAQRQRELQQQRLPHG